MQSRTRRNPTLGMFATLVLLNCAPSSAAGQATHTRTRPISGPSPAELVELSDLSGVTLSPNQSMVVFRTEKPSLKANTVRLAWYVAPADGSQPARFLASAGEPIFSSAGTLTADRPQWSNDSQWIYYRGLVSGQIQVFRINVKTRLVEKITRSDADVLRFVVTTNGKSLVYEVKGASRAAIARETAAEYRNGVPINAKIDPGQSLFAAVDIDGKLAAERLSGKWFARVSILGDQTPNVEIMPIGSRRSHAATSAEAVVLELNEVIKPASSTSSSLSADRRSDGRIAFVSAEQGARRLRWAAAVQAQDFTECHDAACANVIAARWRGNHDEIVFTRSDNANGTGGQSLWLWDIVHDVVRPVYQSTAQLNDGENEQNPFCQIGNAVAVCVRAAGSQPPELIAINLASGRSRVIFAPNALLAASIHIPTRWLSWQLDNGPMVSGQLLLPPADGPVPLFISYYHCNGFMKGSTGDQFPFHAMAAAGIAVLCLQPVPAQKTGPATGVADYQMGKKAVLTAIDDLAARHMIDPHEVGMGGLSFGSEVTTWIAMKTNALKAISISSGQLGLVYYYLNHLPGRDFARVLKSSWGLASPETSPEAWRQVSVSMNTDHIKAPTLMQLPEQEYRDNMELYEGLIDHGTPTEMFSFPNEPHITEQPAHRLAIYQRNLAWFKKWLFR